MALSSAQMQDESQRLAALRRYNVLDTAAEAPFDRVTAMLRKVLDVPMAAISLIDGDRQWFKSRSGLEISETPRDAAFCDYTIRSREPLVVSDAGHDERFSDNPLVVGDPHIASYAGIPLTTSDGQNIGALCVLDRVPRKFTTAEVSLLQDFADIVINELELRQIAMHDPLTGALNRRAIAAAATTQILRQQRYQRPSALILFDLDHFKSVNDRFGHPCGDEVLVSVANHCGAAIRAEDIFARVGGEEFALLLPETDAPTALRIANRLRTELIALRMRFDAQLTVTASFGVAPLTPMIKTADDWLAAADTALYAAKHAGRNCCRLVQSLSALR